MKLKLSDKQIKRIAQSISNPPDEDLITGEDDRLLNEIISRVETDLSMVNQNIEYTKGTSKEKEYQKVAAGLQMVLDFLNNLMYGDPEYHNKYPEQPMYR